jgi:hypothetical protein
MLETLDLSSINILAVLAAAAALWFAGWVWYLPKVFGDAWSGLTGADRKPDRGRLPLALLGHFLLALVLAILIRIARAETLVEGLFIAVLAWLGFIVAPEINRLVWEKIPFNLLLVRTGHYLVGFMMAGAVLAIRR